MIVGETCDADLLAALKAEGLDGVDKAFDYRGGEDLDKPGLGGRWRTRLRLTDAAGRTHELYLKRYDGEPLAARFRRWWTYGRMDSPARVEFDNIRVARRLGVPTMREVLFDERPGPRGGRSFLVVTAVPGDALSRCGERFLDAEERRDGAKSFTAALAGLVAALHAGGYVHRDLYASHVFLHEREGGFDLHLIDLARMFRPFCRTFRWRVKDLAQLKYSMPSAWVAAHWEEFLSAYLGGRPDAGRYARAVERKAASIRRREQRRAARKAGGTA